MAEKEEKVEAPEQAPVETPEETPKETPEDIDSKELELAKAMIVESETKVAKAESKQKQAEFTIEKLKKQFKQEDPEAVDTFELNQKIESAVNDAVAEATNKLTEQIAKESAEKVARLKSQLSETQKSIVDKTTIPGGGGQKLPQKVETEAPDQELAKFMTRNGFKWDGEKGEFVK